MKVTHKIIPILALFLLVYACQDSNDKIVMNNLKSKWDKKNVQSFDFDINDAHNPKNIIFIVRNNNDYPYSNLRLIASIEENKKTLSVDTLNFILAKPNGEWIGTGFGDTKEIMFQYKPHYTFPKNGKYNVKITQAMRKNNLQGIEDIGINIQNIKP